MKGLVQKDGRVWLGLLFLFSGTLLSDRAFALWRNDTRNFSHWDGTHPTSAELTAMGARTSPLVAHLQQHSVIAGIACTGVAMVVVALYLLSSISGPAVPAVHSPGSQTAAP